MLSRNIDKAKKAFKNKDIEAAKLAHDAQQGKYEKHNTEQGQYIKSLVYGGLDGIITTFAVVAGVAGASLSPAIVLIMGFANLIADGLSMAIGDYLSTKAEMQYKSLERERETWEVENYPEGEKLELIELYMDKGMSQEDAETVTEIISKNEKTWVDIMMIEELGIIEEEESPVKNAMVTFTSFVIFGFIPILAYVLSRFIPYIAINTFAIACFLTGATLFALGALKVKITEENWIKSGLEMLIVGGLAAGAAYIIGNFLSVLV
ncbi:VIT1/CCC1 transporter family protein [Clostridium polynesiense]|uniref:VIT1/CCC1 transporter family protein n=1 Tax=Clostridium polynesiense TaxID=1325933 RepID=UPI000590AAB7|nr:VIT1/CCC1 transporter family protein [Clostridium polynesiense]